MPVQLMNSTLIPLCTHLGERLGVPIGDAFLPAAGRRSSGKRAKFLAYLACWDDSAPYVARGLLQILQPKDSQFLDADGRKLFTDRLLKGKSDPGRGTFQFQIFIQASSPEIWRKTIFGGEEVLAGKWGGLFLGYLLGKNFRRRDRDDLIPPRRMDAAVCRAEVCYPFGREHGRHRAMRRREFITLLGGAAGRSRRGRGSRQGYLPLDSW